MKVRTVGELRDVLEDYPADVELDVWLNGADRLSKVEVFRESSVHLATAKRHSWPSIVVDF